MGKFISNIEEGYTGRNVRAKMDNVNYIVQMYDVDKEESTIDLYHHLMDLFSKMIRRELGVKASSIPNPGKVIDFQKGEIESLKKALDHQSDKPPVVPKKKVVPKEEKKDVKGKDNTTD